MERMQMKGECISMSSNESHDVSWFFFFQAEDGIRDLTVTGVQTCALPICPRSNFATQEGRFGQYPNVMPKHPQINAKRLKMPGKSALELLESHPVAAIPAEIGRASCRERV